MKLILLFIILVSSACESENSQNTNIDEKPLGKNASQIIEITECKQAASSHMFCRLSSNDQAIEVKLNLETLAEDEWLIKSVTLSDSAGKNLITVEGSDEVILLEGDILLMQYRDINFDNKMDLAISTSFGTPNLYFDYWIKTATNRYLYVGNHPVFLIDTTKKQLSTSTKSNAAEYQQQQWEWQGKELVPAPSLR